MKSSTSKESVKVRVGLNLFIEQIFLEYLLYANYSGCVNTKVKWTEKNPTNVHDLHCISHGDNCHQET
jgi:hypothetical protein